MKVRVLNNFLDRVPKHVRMVEPPNIINSFDELKEKYTEMSYSESGKCFYC